MLAFLYHALPSSIVRTRPSHVTCGTSSPPRRTILTTHNPLLPAAVRIARATWSAFHAVLMSELAPTDAHGNYVRPVSKSFTPATKMGATSENAFQTARTVSSVFSADTRSLVLYAGMACPWCHRALLARALLKLHSSIGVRIVAPGEDGLWILTQTESDSDCRLLRDVYLRAEKGYQGRFTAPLLMDEIADSIASNESGDIINMLSTKASSVRVDEHTVVWLCPPPDNDVGVDVEQLTQVCDMLYDNVNNGVYRCGFASSQAAYEDAVSDVFTALDRVEKMLLGTRFLCSAYVVTEADVRLFPTVFRFDSVYSLIFKVFHKSIAADYPAISAWMRGMFVIGLFVAFF